MTDQPQRIGLLGGSFNPAHDGHVHISRQALALLDLDEVWWLVSPLNPLKSEADMAPLAERLKRAQAAAKPEPRIRVSAIETELGTRYTVDTVQALQARHPDKAFVWLTGADNLRQMVRWKHWRTLFRLVPIAVFPRSPYTVRALSSRAAKTFEAARVGYADAPLLADLAPPAWVLLNASRHPASATSIREARKIGGKA